MVRPTSENDQQRIRSESERKKKEQNREKKTHSHTRPDGWLMQSWPNCASTTHICQMAEFCYYLLTKIGFILKITNNRVQRRKKNMVLGQTEKKKEAKDNGKKGNKNCAKPQNRRHISMLTSSERQMKNSFGQVFTSLLSKWLGNSGSQHSAHTLVFPQPRPITVNYFL